MRLRTNLFLLVAGAVAPLVLVTLVLGLILVTDLQETVHRSGVDRNRAVMSAVDAELRGHVTTLQAIAASSSLQRGDLRAFADELRLGLDSQPTWLTAFLSDAAGRPLVAASVLAGGAVPADADPASARKAIESGRPAYGNVAVWNPAGTYGVAVRWPVRVNDRVAYLLTAVVDLEQFQRLIVEQKLPARWRSGVVDAAGRFVARVPPRTPANMASPDFRAATARSAEGWYRGRTVEGDDTFTAHLTSSTSGWSLGLAIPTDLVYGPAIRAALGTGAAMLATLVVVLGFAYVLSRRIADPIHALAEHARAKRSAVVPVETDIVEIAAVARVLQQAHSAAEERERLLERERTALLDADRAKDEFLAMLGHELRNPLSAIGTAAHVLRLAREETQHTSALTILERQTRHMTRLVDDLLEISRLTMGKVVLSRDSFDLHAAVSGVATAWLGSGRLAPGALRVTGEPAWVSADRGRIEQVVANLVDNAAKFGGPEIEIRTRNEGDTVVLDVLDRGPGLPTGAERRIFDRFVQGPQGIDRAAGGLGLGLAIVRQLVELHGGSADAANRDDGPGARFTVRLPRAAAEETRGDALAAARDIESLKILVVEDLVDVGETLAAVLRLRGHEVRLVARGADAIRRAGEDVPDVVLLDIGLPDISGYEVARGLRANPATRDVAIVAISGYGQTADEHQALVAGCDLHLRKPVDPDDLVAAIARVRSARALSAAK